MQTGDVAVHSVFDGVISLPPGLLYPEVPVSVWQGVPGALDGEGMLPVPFASKLGATDLFDASDTDGVARVRELTSGRGVEFSVEATGVPAVMTQAVAGLAPLGHVAILGVAPGAEVRTDAFALLEGRSITGPATRSVHLHSAR